LISRLIWEVEDPDLAAGGVGEEPGTQERNLGAGEPWQVSPEYLPCGQIAYSKREVWAGAGRRNAAVERWRSRRPIPAFRHVREKSPAICLAKIPSPFIREPNRGSFSLPPRMARIRFSTLLFLALRCCVSHASKSGATAWGSRSRI